MLNSVPPPVQTVVLVWPVFRLEYRIASGFVVTTYDDGTWSGCGPVPDDTYHAKRLRITPGEHRFSHELAHHVVAFYKGLPTSPVIDRDAHSVPQPGKEAADEERTVTAFQYYAHGRLDVHNDPPPLNVGLGGLLDDAAAEFRWIFEATRRRTTRPVVMVR